jgi:hypothetical protein
MFYKVLRRILLGKVRGEYTEEIGALRIKKAHILSLIKRARALKLQDFPKK